MPAPSHPTAGRPSAPAGTSRRRRQRSRSRSACRPRTDTPSHVSRRLGEAFHQTLGAILDLGRAKAQQHEKGQQEQKSQHAEAEGRGHLRRQRSALVRGEDDRMLPAPPDRRLVDDRHVDRSEDSEDRAEPRRLLAVVGVAANEQTSDEQQPEDQRRGDLGFPGPPDTPGRLGPQRPGGQHDRAQHHTGLGRGPGEVVPGQLPCAQVDDRRHEHHEHREEGHDRGGHVEVEDALGRTHHLLGRCVDKGHPDRHRHHRRRDGPECKDAPINPFHRRSPDWSVF